MNLVSLPVIVVASITFYVGIYHLLIFFKGSKRNEDLYFSLTCLIIVVYDIFSILLYISDSPLEGRVWQKWQYISFALAIIFFLNFISFFTGNRFPLIKKIFMSILLIGMLIMFSQDSGLLLSKTLSDVKEISLPWGSKVIYNEMSSGPIAYFNCLLLISIIIYLIFIAIEYFPDCPPHRKKPLVLSICFFSIGVLNDAFVSVGFYKFIYIIEHMHGLIVLVMTIFLSRNVIISTSMQEALKTSTRKYFKIFESIRDVYYESDLEGTILEISPSVSEVLKYTREELIGASIFEFFKFNEEKRKLINSILRDGILQNYELLLLDKDKNEHYCLLNAKLLMDGNVNSYRIVGSMRDITKFKTSQKEMQILQEKLSRSRKMEALGRLAGGVAHDLNNILAAVVGYPDLILLEIPEEQEEVRESIMEMKEAGMRAGAVVQDLLTIARGIPPIKKVVNLNNIVNDFFNIPEGKSLKESYPNVDYFFKLSNQLWNIIGADVSIHKVLLNLITNAVEAMPNGGKVIISTWNQNVTDSIDAYETINTGEYSVLSVQDFGIGISEDDLEKIFEPFYSKKTQGKSGTGLGMSIVWSSVKEHNGFINVISNLDQGATFQLFFPATKETVTTKKLNHTVESLFGNGESILVVDDQEEQRILVKKLLQRLGYKVVAFERGCDAIEYLSKNSVNLIILDMILSNGETGIDIFKEIVKIESKQKVIIASGYSDKNLVNEAFSFGAKDYIHKPYDLKKLGMVIKSALKE